MVRLAPSLALALLTCACSKVDAPSSTNAVEPSADGSGASAEAGERDGATTDPPGVDEARASARPIVLITDPQALARLPVGSDLGELLFGVPGASGHALNEHLAYRTMLNAFDFGGEAVHDPGRTRAGGLFFTPRWWFTAENTAFTLVGVVNRIDRRDFGQTACGETRLLYRLGYAEDGGAIQRLPAAFNVVFEQPDDGQGCVEVARRWMVDEGEDVVAALTRAEGPLHPSLLTSAQLLAIETNVRVGEDADGAGVNELRAFSWDRSRTRLEPIRLEFEPMYKTMLVRANVRELLTPEGLEVIERGAGELPTLSTRDWADVRVDAPSQGEFAFMWKRFVNHGEATPLPDTGLSSTRAGITHRLVGMSCTGCHDQRSVAGFHLPGEGGSERLRGGASAHLLSQLPWRERYVQALAAGETPELTRPLHNDGPPGFGRHCSVAGSPVDTLTCDPGFACVETTRSSFGLCLPEGYAGPGPCTTASADCRPPSPWFPGGCERLACVEGEPCAGVALTTDFSSCKGEDDSWACAQRRAERARVDGCALQSDCRDGYVCVELDEGGGCLPRATLAEFRVIGHRARLR